VSLVGGAAATIGTVPPIQVDTPLQFLLTHANNVIIASTTHTINTRPDRNYVFGKFRIDVKYT
jgi:hypothetical protein